MGNCIRRKKVQVLAERKTVESLQKELKEEAKKKFKAAKVLLSDKDFPEKTQEQIRNLILLFKMIDTRLEENKPMICASSCLENMLKLGTTLKTMSTTEHECMCFLNLRNVVSFFLRVSAAFLCIIYQKHFRPDPSLPWPPDCMPSQELLCQMRDAVGELNAGNDPSKPVSPILQDLLDQVLRPTSLQFAKYITYMTIDPVCRVDNVYSSLQYNGII